MSDAALADPPADPPAAIPDDAGVIAKTPSEADRIAAAIRALKTRGTPHQVRVRLIEAGCDAEVADRVVAKARAALLADSRKSGARIAEATVLAMCGSLLLLLVPGLEVVVGVGLVVGMIALAVAGLIWLSGVGGD